MLFKFYTRFKDDFYTYITILQDSIFMSVFLYQEVVYFSSVLYCCSSASCFNVKDSLQPFSWGQTVAYFSLSNTPVIVAGCWARGNTLGLLGISLLAWNLCLMMGVKGPQYFQDMIKQNLFSMSGKMRALTSWLHFPRT